jgi:hypothetical protein
LGAAAVSAAAGALPVRFLGLACASALGVVAATVLLSGLAERAPFGDVALVAFFFLVAMMHLLRE